MKKLLTLTIALLLVLPAASFTQYVTGNISTAHALVLKKVGVYQKAILDLVNVERKKAGLKAVKYNTTLEKSALGHAKDMAAKKYFDHVSPTGITPDIRMKAFYKNKNWTSYEVGENIWMWEKADITDPKALAKMVMYDPETGWMQSPKHRANILHPKFRELGVGYFKNTAGDVYFVQNFGVIEVAR